MPGAGWLHGDTGHINNTANVRFSNQATADLNQATEVRNRPAPKRPPTEAALIQRTTKLFENAHLVVDIFLRYLPGALGALRIGRRDRLPWRLLNGHSAA